MKLVKQSQIRILHVVGGMDRAGIETWLMHILRNLDRDHFQMDFLVHTSKPCAYDDEVRALGSRIFPCPYASQPNIYALNFKKILRESGPYDIVHSHVHHFSGYVLRLAQQMSVPVRIAHSHLDTSRINLQAGWRRQLYIALMKWWIARYATGGLAASNIAAADLFGSFWKSDRRWQTLYCGINLIPFRNVVAPCNIRSELGLVKDSVVVGHVGRFESQKNHQFLLEIAVEVVKREPSMRFLFVGNGSLYVDIEQKTIQMGLANHVILCRSRNDIAQLMLSVMDVFLFPSLYEGLGLVLIEAQAAGLPCVFSDILPEEADIVKPLIHRISLSKSASTWAETVIAVSKQNTSLVRQKEAFNTVEKSSFDIHKSLEELQKYYINQLNKYR